MKYIVSILLFLAFSNLLHAQTRVTVGNGSSNERPGITGVVRDINSNEELIGATIYVPSIEKGVTTDINGYYELDLNKGEYLIQFSMLGFGTKEYLTKIEGRGKLNVVLDASSLELREVEITTEAADHNVKSNDMGKQVLSIESIKELPSFVGEVDILKSITLLPGVSSVGEASSGFNVRGGSSDQNLILLGGAPLYNPSHLFGFFSAFNADAISRVTLYKGGVPPKFGGRGSSVLDINYKNGDLKRWKGSVALGSISSKALVEGPILDNKISILVSGRTSYTNWVLRTAKDPSISNSSATFHDANGRLNYIVNDKNKVAYTYYISADEFSFDSDTSIQWSNQNHIIDWNYSNGRKFTLDATFIKTGYKNSIINSSNIDQFDLNSGVENLGASLKADLNLFNENSLSFGVEGIQTEINPGELEVGAESSLNEKVLEREKANELAAFLDLKVNLSKNLSLTLGSRYTRYDYLGPNSIKTYEEYIPKSLETVIDSTFYAKDKSIINYSNLDPRVTLRWSLSESASIKAAYNRMHQYIHLISNTSAIAPTDIWKLSDPFLKPQVVTQYSFGVFKNFQDNGIETSVEVYYKDSDNLVEYKDGAELILNDHLETELINGIGRAYGLEFYIKKKTGRLNGWLSYTYSRSLVRVEGPYAIERINKGEWYSSNFDKPHDFTAVAVYYINRLWSISGNLTYSTGRPVTYPSAKLFIEGNTLAYFDERNGSRVPDYNRLDFSISFQPENRTKIWGGKWKLSIYNVLGRQNAFSVFFRDVLGSPPQPYKLSIIGSPFPSLSYEFKF